MENFSFTEIAKELDKVKEVGITFEDKALSWDTAEDVKEVVQSLETQKVVHYLKLEGNTLGVPAAKAIGEALKRHPEFRKALWRNMFTRRLKSEIPEALKCLGNGLIVANAHLSVLDLSDNALGPNGMVGLEDLLRSPVCFSLEKLYLNNCGLGIGGGKMLSKALIDCHERSNAAGKPLQLKTFVAGRNRLENEGAAHIAHMLGTLKTLEEIVMPQNSIYHVGIKALAEAFKKNPKLRIINLNDNTLEHRGAEALANALELSSNLQELNLGDCLLKSRGALFIADVLDSNHNTLEIVDLSHNEIQSHAGVELATALQNKPNLKNLNLDGNQFGKDGIQRIKDIMNASPNSLALAEFEEDQSEDSDDDQNGDGDDDEDNEEGSYEQETESVDDEEGETYEGEDSEESYDDEQDDGTEDTGNVSKCNERRQVYINDTSDSEVDIRGKSALEVSTEKTNSTQITTAENFCLNRQPCSLQMFESLEEDNKLTAFLNIIDQFSDDNYILLLMFTTLKCAHLSKSSPAALDVAMDLFKESFDYAVKNNVEKDVMEYYLVQLGLAETEEEFKPLYDTENCRYALSETLKRRNISSEFIKNGFNDHLFSESNVYEVKGITMNEFFKISEMQCKN